jgi:hypothetical protein
MKTLRSVAFGLTMLALASWAITPAFAQRGGRGGGGGGGGNGGGGGGGGAHISSGGGGGGGGGPRMSSGGGGNARGDGGSSRSFSSRDGGGNVLGDGGSNRTFNSRDGGGSRDGGSRDISTLRDGGNDSGRHESFFRGNNFDNEIARGGRDNNRDRSVSSFLNNRGDGSRNRDFNNWAGYSNRVRNDWSRRDRNDLPFRYGWWDNYRNDRWPIFSPFAYSRWSNRPYYWWGWTPVGRLTNWLAYGWDRPRYWSYGPDANIYCDDGYVYYDGERYEPVADYYQQVYDLAHSVPKISEEQAKDMDWAPLGVFAVARDNQQNEDEQRTIQLAVNKEGVISGTFYNPANRGVHPLSGMVDERTQRAAWAFADDDRPKLVFETSINNLTRDESTMMVHYGPNQDDTEVWHLVRLERPEASQQASNDDDQRDRGNDLP